MTTANGNKQELYRQFRLWHSYLSAIAFIALLFFAITGLLLNHPNTFTTATPPLIDSTLTLTPAELANIAAVKNPAETLATLIGSKIVLRGAYKRGEISGHQIFIRLQGVRGSSDIRADLQTGKVEVTVETANAIAVLNGLHRGELAGTAWRVLIDISSGALIALSLVGYCIFLSLRFRLRTALALTGLSLAAVFAVFIAYVA